MIYRSVVISYLLTTVLLFSLSGNTIFAQRSLKSNKSAKAKARNDKKEEESQAEYLFIKAMSAYGLKEYNEAIKLFADAAHKSPKNAAIYYKMAEAYHQLGYKDEALNNAKKALSIAPKNKYYYSLLVELYMNDNRLNEAAQVMEDMIEQIPSTSEHLIELGSIYEELGRYYMNLRSTTLNDVDGKTNKRSKKAQEKAIQNFNKALDTYERFTKKFGVIDNVIAVKQQIYLGLNNDAAAIKEGEKLIEAHPNEVNYKLAQAELLFKLGKIQPAITLLEKAGEQHSKDSEIFLVLYEYYNENNEAQKANEALEKAFKNPRMSVNDKVRLITGYLQYSYDDTKRQTALQLAIHTKETHPDHAQAHAVLGDVYLVMNNKSEARKAYLKAIELDDAEPAVWQQIISIDLDLAQHEQVVSHTGKALERFPDRPLFWLYQGISYMILQKNEQAVASLEKGRELASHDYNMESQFNANLGDAYNAVEAYEKSDLAYEAALEFDPNNAHVLNNYSYFLSLRSEKLPDAKNMCERLILMHPEDPTYLDTYAWVLYKMNDLKGAKKYLEKALLKSTDGTIIEHYGDILFRLGDKSAAVSTWKEAKQAGGASDLIDKKIEEELLHE